MQVDIDTYIQMSIAASIHTRDIADTGIEKYASLSHHIRFLSFHAAATHRLNKTIQAYAAGIY